MLPFLLPTRRALFAFALSTMATMGAAHAQRLDVVYVPTAPQIVESMMTIAGVSSRDYVIDLGSGDGRIAIAAAGRGARALGVDLDPARIREAQANAKAMGVAGRVTFRRENLFGTRLADATVVTMYLLPSLNLKLRPRLLRLRPGTRIVSHAFDMGDWQPDGRADGPVYLWIVPARVAGSWQVGGEPGFRLNLQQRFQVLRGTATFGGRSTPLRDAKVRGSEIEFTADRGGQPVTFRGTVTGNRMQGKAGSGEWVAAKRG